MFLTLLQLLCRQYTNVTYIAYCCYQYSHLEQRIPDLTLFVVILEFQQCFCKLLARNSINKKIALYCFFLTQILIFYIRNNVNNNGKVLSSEKINENCLNFNYVTNSRYSPPVDNVNSRGQENEISYQVLPVNENLDLGSWLCQIGRGQEKFKEIG